MNKPRLVRPTDAELAVLIEHDGELDYPRPLGGYVEAGELAAWRSTHTSDGEQR